MADWRWDRGQLRFRSAWREEDNKISPVERTCRELKKIMNTIYSNLQVEMEHTEMFEDKTLPTLDFRLLVQDNSVLYLFFQKPVANKCVIHKQSALGENSKIVSHTQNLIRRMKCTRELLPMESRIVFIDEFCWQLISSRLERDCLRCKEAVENGESLENLFSRKRSLRRKLAFAAYEEDLKQDSDIINDGNIGTDSVDV